VVLSLERDQLLREAAATSEAGNYAHSLTLIDQALICSPGDAELIFSRATTLYDCGRFREARDTSLRAQSLGFSSRALYLQLGWASLFTADLRSAENWMRNAVAVQPTTAKAMLGLASALHAQRRLSEAAAALEESLALDPNDFDALTQMGGCKLDQGDPVAAEQFFRKAIVADGARPGAWANLAVALGAGRQDRVQEAIDALDRAGALEAKTGVNVDSFIGMAVNLRDEGRIAEVLELYEANLARHPAAIAHYNYALGLQACGRLRESWTHFEFRWLTDPIVSMRPAFAKPAWAGQDLRGKTILVRTELGFGDVFQFCRYVPELKPLGANVVLQVRAGLEQLMSGLSGIDRVMATTEPPPAFDYYAHLLSLPRAFGTDVDTIPARTPYLRANPALIEAWALRLDPQKGSLRVGLVWGGNPTQSRDRYRTMPLRLLTQLFDIEGVQFNSLQKGPPADQIAAFAQKQKLFDFAAQLNDFADTAAMISQLDLVICVDTSVAHLAGALGKPVWVMLPEPPYWWWSGSSERSPWYPTMRLFRQKERGDWGDVVERVKAALEERVAAGGMGGEAEAKGSVAVAALRPVQALPREAPGHRPGFSAVAECRHGILQYLPDEPLLGDAIGWYGEYREAELTLLGRLIGAGSTVMEVGAGIGAHAVFLGRLLGDDGHLFLYEGRPVVKRILQQNLGANRIGNYTLMRRMLGRSGETAPDATAGMVTETLDELRLERLDWLKSNEAVPALDVLAGAGDTLWRLRPRLLLAASSEAEVSAIAERVKEFGYRCWRMAMPLYNPDNFNRREADIFSGRLAWSVLAIPEEIEIDLALDQRPVIIVPLA